ncbi:MAG TPA: hypothetical protein PK024_01455 [Methanospirillum sp.]|uniref:hypothetical protein n=1 Tax=Methanospirillum sp. TaxID=45200 RepID=UPI002C924994|nr:hypothetical protein [Methanospirillum sp.]HOJ95497.1 hypothetical protein [Methanospirillum sp.]HPP77226.1 hypothetical protein [Methanospirillum sp.]
MKHETSDRHSGIFIGPHFIIYLALFFLLVCINSLGAKYFVFSYPIVPGVSAFYLIVAFMVVFALWFGIWGVLAAYAGCVIGAGVLSGLPADVSLYWSLADLWQVLIPFLAFRFFHADPVLKSWRDRTIFFISGVVLNNIAGALWGSYTLVFGGFAEADQVTMIMTGWFFGNAVVCGVIAPIILMYVTPWMKNHELYMGE